MAWDATGLRITSPSFMKSRRRRSRRSRRRSPDRHGRTARPPEMLTEFIASQRGMIHLLSVHAYHFNPKPGPTPMVRGAGHSVPRSNSSRLSAFPIQQCRCDRNIFSQKKHCLTEYGQRRQAGDDDFTIAPTGPEAAEVFASHPVHDCLGWSHGCAGDC